jgi:hypothetical protein
MIEPIVIGDFTAGRRMIFITVIALAIGAMATFVASASGLRWRRHRPRSWSPSRAVDPAKRCPAV